MAACKYNGLIKDWVATLSDYINFFIRVRYKNINTYNNTQSSQIKTKTKRYTYRFSEILIASWKIQCIDEF